MSTEPSLALQKLIRGHLSGNAAVTALVPAENIFDRSGTPEIFPCILIGDGYTNHADLIESFHENTFADVHVWTEEPGLAEAKAIAAAVRGALRSGPWAVDGHRCINLRVSRTRFLRDHDGGFAHAIVSIEAILQEAVS
jgi:hypothetical protein